MIFSQGTEEIEVIEDQHNILEEIVVDRVEWIQEDIEIITGIDKIIIIEEIIAINIEDKVEEIKIIDIEEVEEIDQNLILQIRQTDRDKTEDIREEEIRDKVEEDRTGNIDQSQNLNQEVQVIVKEEIKETKEINKTKEIKEIIDPIITKTGEGTKIEGDKINNTEEIKDHIQVVLLILIIIKEEVVKEEMFQVQKGDKIIYKLKIYISLNLIIHN